MPNQCHCSGDTRRILAALIEGIFFIIFKFGAYCSVNLRGRSGMQIHIDYIHIYIYTRTFVDVLANVKSQSFAMPPVKLHRSPSCMV